MSRVMLCSSVQELLYDKQKLLDNGERVTRIFAPKFPSVLNYCWRPLSNIPSLFTYAGGQSVIVHYPEGVSHMIICGICSVRHCCGMRALLSCLKYVASAGDRWETEIAANLKAESLYRCGPGASEALSIARLHWACCA